MRLSQKAGRRFAAILISLMLLWTIGPLEVFGQAAGQASSQQTQAIIDQAESYFRQGQEAFAKGERDAARNLFDQALDTVLRPGMNLRANSTLDSYYRDLVDRIHRFEAHPEDDHSPDERAEIVEPSLLDELSKIDDNELAMVTPDGVKIFGKYDFDFSVAPPVLQFINFFVSGRGRSTMNIGLQRSGRYRQMAEKIFKEERVPLDLIWLAQAESVWKPNALSHAAAKGIWQFIPATGTRFGLAQTAWIDQRSHPELSTRAAARYLRWLHDHFAGDWLLAMAAYNSGENRVDSAIARCGYADFWEIHRRGLLPQETRNYVPIILSIIIISKNQKRYGFDVNPDPPLNYELVELPDQTDLKVIADLIGVPYETVQDLNPELRRGVSPPDQRYRIKLPKGLKKQFEIAYAELPEDQRVRRIAVPREEVAETGRPTYRTALVSYKVRRGDTLFSLARRHGISVQELARLNRLSARGQVRAGQTIRIPKSVSSASGKTTTSRSKVGRYSRKKAIKSRSSARSRRKAIRRPTSNRRR
jgi:membrane-bound lytic murein transglycosylase D